MLTAIMRSMPWESRAACRDTFDETRTRGTWVTEPSGELSTPTSVVAKLEVCNGCPVRAECLRFALEASFETFGIWGGTTSIERRTLAPRSTTIETHMGLAYQAERRAQIRRAEQILAATHADRLKRWRRFAQEARRTKARGGVVQAREEAHHQAATGRAAEVYPEVAGVAAGHPRGIRSPRGADVRQHARA
jgi:WhiB family transcriptional regulator, redox-sensing transcriptional regulator